MGKGKIYLILKFFIEMLKFVTCIKNFNIYKHDIYIKIRKILLS